MVLTAEELESDPNRKDEEAAGDMAEFATRLYGASAAALLLRLCVFGSFLLFLLCSSQLCDRVKFLLCDLRHHKVFLHVVLRS